MQLSREDAIRLQHMLDAAQDALDFAAGNSRIHLDENKQLALSLARCLEIVGEAAGRASPETRQNLPMIPWADMIGMRNRLIHAYYDVNLTVVWKTVSEELPSLVRQLSNVLANAETGN